MTVISLEQAIRNAIEVEQAAAKFYEELASQAASDSTRTLFEKLRQEELGHAKAIEAFGRQLTDGRLPDDATGAWEIVETSPVWRHVEGITYEQALEVALEAERGAAFYYGAVASSVTSHSVRSFFEQLAENEQNHVRDIIEMMDRDDR